MSKKYIMWIVLIAVGYFLYKHFYVAENKKAPKAIQKKTQEVMND